MYVSPIVEQLQTYSCREVGRKTLIIKFAPCDGMSLLAKKKTERVLCLTNLSLQVCFLCKNRVIVRLCCLHRC